ncbi:LysR family transcriptional regulator [Streptomyces eurocidicus]|uniref:DNA-binding transcriptional LysR family regulator n=1 Tax=Streptomyces eurocidicus TaxID=66423 RepID=A0A2N8NV64_STREU|nr:LysR substrate-binding domain-containing protein [Streptomyces eurocidicus]MBB5122481.1 DNA-binding transcriptional LysR family regulator [Streptomyces eurocidicus]MBF6052112.1 LysR family transcriptional regulator [Streptomyces eurocidicus]PNE32643.1 LysR family transcriptional regulator [Streptomyces eurocidicus]
MFDPTQLRTFLTVAQTLSFTQAAHRLGLRQSTVSQQVRRLEEAAGRQLFARDTHGVALTEDGEAMLGFARTILAANERAASWFAGTRLRGRLRFGASEDFVLTRLPEILAGFRHEHPEVDLELTVDLSETLQQQLAAGRLDLVLAKRPPGGPHGRLVWRDSLVWIGGERLRLEPHRPLPLVVFPPPAVTRARALEVLERHGRAWRVTCTSGSLNGLVAAARAGLGVMAHTRGMIPPGLVRIPARAGLPDLGAVDVVLLHGAPPDGAARGPAEALAEAILAAGDRLHVPAPGAGPGTAPSPEGTGAGPER